MTTVKLDLLKSPFQPFNDYQLLDTKISLHKMMRFYKYLQQILTSETHSIYIADQLQVSELINALLSRYKNCEYIPQLKGVSANSKVSVMKVTDNSDQKDAIFLKFQLKDSQDDIRLDAYNAYALQLLMPDSPHLIKTMDLLKTFYNEHMDDAYWNLDDYIGPNGSILIRDERIEVPIPQFLPHITKDPIVLRNFNDILEEKNIKIATLLTAKNIMGPSLRKVIYQLDTNNFGYYLPRLKNLFYTLINLGKYGFVHNDAHNNNVLFDINTHEFSLIDYGRVSLDPKLLGGNLNKINKYIDWVYLHTDPSYLTHFLQNYETLKDTFGRNLEYEQIIPNHYITYKLVRNMIDSPFLQNYLIKHLYMFDISTITLGILDQIFIPKPDAKPTDDAALFFKLYLWDKGLIDITPDKIVVREFNDLCKLLNTSELITTLKSVNMDTFLPGIIWASFIFTSLYEVDPNIPIIEKQEGKIVLLVIDRHLLKQNRFMHYYYQYSAELLWNCKTTMFNYLNIAVKQVFQSLDSSQNSSGGMLSSSVRIPRSVRSLGSQYSRSRNSLRSNYLSPKPKPMDGQMESATEYNRTETPPEHLTKWLENYKPKPIPKINPNEDPFVALKPYLEKVRIQNENYHPYVEELQKYKPPPASEEFIANVFGYKQSRSKSIKNGSTSR
jgi:hypothetical protein